MDKKFLSLTSNLISCNLKSCTMYQISVDFGYKKFKRNKIFVTYYTSHSYRFFGLGTNSCSNYSLFEKNWDLGIFHSHFLTEIFSSIRQQYRNAITIS